VSEIWERLAESAGHVISEVDKGGQIQSAIGGLRQRLAEADRKRKVNQLKQEIRDLRAREAQAIDSLSAQVLALHEAGSLTQPELVSLCKGITDIRGQIQALEAELDALQPVAAPASGEARCTNCGAAVLSGAAFCQRCGTRMAGEEKAAPARFCIHCGTELREGARFCPTCGQVVPQG
jgi:predicted nucleic acid-binding Zn ribbon protein